MNLDSAEMPNKRRSLQVTVFGLLLLSMSCLAQASVPGALDGTLTVTPSGGGSYQIPIKIPPGTNGMQPELAIVYNSSGGNGLLGEGGGLAGLSEINRCPSTLAQDNWADGVDFDSYDRYCLDGMRLIAIDGADGGNGTEYRTEIDSFSKITSHGSANNGPLYFKVRTKSGVTYEYGNSADSRIEAQGQAAVLTWAVNKLIDPHGNYVEYEYFEDSATGAYRPTAISYTGNDAQGIMPYNFVTFVYESRQDIIQEFTAGSSISETKRLKEVVVSTIDGGQTKKYKLQYQNGLDHRSSKIVQITACGTSDSSCFAPTKLSWNTPTPPTLFQPSVYSKPHPGTGGTYTKHTGDFNGDGIDDIAMVHWSSSYGLIILNSMGRGDGTFANAVYSKPHNGTGGAYTKHTGDFNGDGLTDIAMVHWSSSYGLIVLNALGQSDGTFASTEVKCLDRTIVQQQSISTGGGKMAFFALGLEKATIYDNQEWFSSSEVRFHSFVADKHLSLPGAEAILTASTLDERREIVHSLAPQVAQKWETITITEIPDRHTFIFGDTGRIVYRSNEVPQSLDWFMLVIEDDSDIRSALASDMIYPNSEKCCR